MNFVSPKIFIHIDIAWQAFNILLPIIKVVSKIIIKNTNHIAPNTNMMYHTYYI